MERVLSKLLSDLDLHHPPCANLNANRSFYPLAVLAWNLLQALPLLPLPQSEAPKRMRPLLRPLLLLPVELKRHARQLKAGLYAPAGWGAWWRGLLADLRPRCRGLGSVSASASGSKPALAKTTPAKARGGKRPPKPKKGAHATPRRPYHGPQTAAPVTSRVEASRPPTATSVERLPQFSKPRFPRPLDQSVRVRAAAKRSVNTLDRRRGLPIICQLVRQNSCLRNLRACFPMTLG